MYIRVCDNPNCRKEINDDTLCTITLSSGRKFEICKECNRKFNSILDSFFSTHNSNSTQNNTTEVKLKKQTKKPCKHYSAVNEVILNNGGIRVLAKEALATSIVEVANRLNINHSTLGKKFRECGIDLKKPDTLNTCKEVPANYSNEVNSNQRD